MPYKYRRATPHKLEKSHESPPKYLNFLKKHFDEKSEVRKAKLRKNIIEARQAKNSSVSKVEISNLGPRFSHCFSEVFKLESKLMEVRSSILLSNKKY